jgi:Tol biopolymer transport system component
MNRNAAVWSLPADPDHAKVPGAMERITDGFAELVPSISSDGRKLGFITVRRKTHTGGGLNGFPEEATKLQARIKDLQTRKESVISNAQDMQWHPQISRDGSTVAYTVGKPGIIYAAPVNGGPARVIVGGKNFLAWDWSLGNKQLLFNAADQRVYSLDLLSGSKKLFLSKPGFAMYQAKFSPDDQTIAAVGCAEGQCRIFVIPLENDTPVPSDRWITIDHPSQWDDKPRWSPNGDLIYFISERDGYLCLWAQRVHSRTKRPIGTPFSVYHFHNARLSIENVGPTMMEIGVAKDKIIMGLGEVTGNIWSLQRN